MGNNIRIGFGASGARKAASDLDQLKDKGEKLKKTFGSKAGLQGLAAGLGAGVALGGINAAAEAITGLGQAAAGAVQDASDLNEQVNKAGVVFGSASDSVEKFASGAAASLGESKREAIEAASAFGNLFNTIGVNKGQSAQMSTELVKLAADLASFHNIDPSDALEKLQAGLVGEARPLRELGVLLSEAEVSSEATALGFKKVNGEFSEGAKVQARYALIMKQTASAQGDFARTSGSMANQQRILNAELENTSAEFGQKLIPIVTEFQRTIIYALDRSAVPLERLKKAAESGSQGAQAQLRMLEDRAQKMGVSLEDAYAAGSSGAETLARTTEANAGKVVDDLGVMGSGFVEMANQAETSTKRVILSNDELVKALSDDAQSLIDGYFDPIEQKYDLRELKAKTVAAIEEQTAAKTVKDKEKAKRELTQALDDEGNALLKLAEKGKMTAKDHADYAKHIKQAYGKIPPVLQAMLDKLDEVNAAGQATVSVKITPVKHTSRNPGPHRARGGAVGAGMPYTVGEDGPETFVPSSSGNIVPNGRGGDTFNLTFVGMGNMSERAIIGTVDRLRAISRRRAA